MGLPGRVLLAGASAGVDCRKHQERESDNPRRDARSGHHQVPGERQVNEIDNRGSTFYLALYWAQTLAAQKKDAKMQARFAKVAKKLEENEAKIIEELLAAQGEAVDLGGYYLPDEEKAEEVMRPSATFNAIIDAM